MEILQQETFMVPASKLHPASGGLEVHGSVIPSHQDEFEWLFGLHAALLMSNRRDDSPRQLLRQVKN